MDLSFFLEQSIVCGVMIHGPIPNFLQAFAELHSVCHVSHSEKAKHSMKVVGDEKLHLLQGNP
jgi:hypothetical protein